MEFDNFITHSIDMFMGKPKSGKTLIAGTYPKPMLYISAGNDGGGRVLYQQFREAVENGDIKVKNIKNDMPVGNKIPNTSASKLAQIFAELRQPGAPKFKTIVIDTVGAIQDDEKTACEFVKGGKQLSTQEWGDISKVMMGIKDVMKRFSEDTGTIIVWIFHTSEQEMYETSGLDKEIRIVPSVTIKTGIKYLSDASNVFYCCRKTVIDSNGDRNVKFLTYVGPHPLMDTGTRDVRLAAGGFVENFSYASFQQMIKEQKLISAKVLTPDADAETKTETENTEE